VTKGQEIALWSAVAAFFGSLLAIGIFDVLNPEQWVQYIGALIVAFITGGAVYARERLELAKQRENGDGSEGEILIRPLPPPSPGPPPVKKPSQKRPRKLD
jgi:hypothetical protein